MLKNEKIKRAEFIYNILQQYQHFYLVNMENLNCEQIFQIRKKCFEKKVKLLYVKNTLLRKALEKYNGKFVSLYDVLKNQTTILLSNNSKEPALIIKEFKEKFQKPILKAAYVEDSFYIGDNQLDVLINLKSKSQLIGEIIMGLQQSFTKLFLMLKSSNDKIIGFLNTLEKRNETNKNN